MFFETGQVLRRRFYFGGIIQQIYPVRVVRHDAVGLLVWLAPDSPMWRAAIPGGGRVRDLDPDAWPADGFPLIPDTWRLDGALIYQPAQNDAQSVWWIFGADGGFSGWYVNLERRVHDGADIDVFDAELDLLVTPDHQWRWKDEESFAQKTGHPRFWSTAEAVAIRERGLRLARLAETRSFPFDGTWCDFRPDPAWEPPPLPASDGAYRGGST